MNDNATQPKPTFTPVQAHQLLVQVGALSMLKLSLVEHTAVQQALAVLKPAAELTLAPAADTIN